MSLSLPKITPLTIAGLAGFGLKYLIDTPKIDAKVKTAAFAVLATASFLIHRSSKKSPVAKPPRYVSPVISKMAQEFLSTAMPFEADLKSAEEFRNASKFFKQITIEDSNKAQQRHVKHVEQTKVAKVPVLVVTPKNYTSTNDDIVAMYLHGGAFTMGSPAHLYQLFAPATDPAGIKTYAVDYPLAPENPYPAAPNACLDVYRELVKQGKKVILIGDSAGTNLGLNLALRAQKEGLPTPAGMVLTSVYADMEPNSDTYHTLKKSSPVITYKGAIPHLEAYAPRAKHDYKDPALSPLNGDYSKMKKMAVRVITGTIDASLGDSTRATEILRKAGHDVELSVKHGLWHNYLQIVDLLESLDTNKQTGEFLIRTIAQLKKVEKEEEKS